MAVHIGKIEVQSKDHMPDFHNVTDEVEKIVAESGIQNGLVTTCRTEGQYHHPGPDHIKFALTFPDEEPKGSLNTDAHLRSCFFGRSENIVLEKGELSLGDFGFIYFIDWDQVRERKRVCEVLVMGE